LMVLAVILVTGIDGLIGAPSRVVLTKKWHDICARFKERQNSAAEVLQFPNEE
jgi:hypothetical protein